jgi:ribosome maturation factor RimP
MFGEGRGGDMDDSTIEQLRALVTPLVADHGLELYDVEHTGGALRVLVDRQGGADLEVIGRLTRAVSDALDEADPLPGRYTLEVSSPGLERPLRTPAHFAAAVGETVGVKTIPGVAGERRFEGTLVASDESGITVEAADGLRSLHLDEIEKARTVFAWGPAPKPGGQKKRTKKKASDSGAPTRKATNR